jgi:carboxyl-terminal processing protease
MAAARVVGLLAGPVPVARLEGFRGPEADLRATDPAKTSRTLVVLINQGTASAAEIIAGALQASGRAKLVGTKTFGKGLAHNLESLSDGRTLFVSLAKAVTPHGRDLLEVALEPDVSASTDESATSLMDAPGPELLHDTQYQAAVRQLVPSATFPPKANSARLPAR